MSHGQGPSESDSDREGEGIDSAVRVFGCCGRLRFQVARGLFGRFFISFPLPEGDGERERLKGV